MKKSYKKFDVIKIKTIGPLIILIMTTLTTSITFAQGQLDNFYYYKGSKVYLEVNKQKISVSFKGETNINTFSSINTSQSEIVEDNSSSFLTPLLNINSENRELEKVSYLELNTSSVTETDYMSSIEDYKKLPNVLMVSPTYKVGEEEFGVSNKFYVKLKKIEDLELLQLKANEMDLEILGHDKFMPLWFVLSIPSPRNLNALNYANIFHETALFDSTEPAFMNHTFIETNDTFFNNQWTLKNTGQNGGTIGNDIKAEQAWSISTGTNIRVAVIDQGIQLNHPDLQQNIFRNSFDAQTGTSPSQVRGSHGTACAGIIGAVSENNIGVAGVAPDSELMSISANFGSTTSSLMLANGMNWAWTNGADVISNSWSGGARSNLFDNAVTNALTNGRAGLGSIVVFSSGNDNVNGSVYPPNSNPLILCVGAIDRCGVRSGRIDIVPNSCDPWGVGSRPGSSFGTPLDVVAGGTNVPTTDLSGGYNLGFGGTSAACPFVSGVVALVLSANPDLTVQEVNTIIEQSAQKVSQGIYTYSNTAVRPNGTWNNELGYGFVDAYKAVLLALNCTKEIYISENVVSGEFDSISASRLITATNTINSGGSAEYKAGEKVILEAGFRARPGSILNASIGDCGSRSLSSSSSSKSLNSEYEVVDINHTRNSKEIEVLSDLKIYPNPTNGLFKVQGSSKFTSYSIQNILGGQIMSNEVNESQLNIDISKFTNGIYFLELQTEDGEVFRKKVIKD